LNRDDARLALGVDHHHEDLEGVEPVFFALWIVFGTSMA
jgi:hypothetical protein